MPSSQDVQKPTPKPKALENGFKKSLSTPTARIFLLFFMVCILITLTYCSISPQRTNTVLTGSEGFAISAKAEQQLNTEQAQFYHNQTLENQSGDGIDISAAKMTVIEKGEFSPEEIIQNPERFIARRHRSETIYLDRQTQKFYNKQGYILMIADIETPTVVQTPAQYEGFMYAQNNTTNTPYDTYTQGASYQAPSASEAIPQNNTPNHITPTAQQNTTNSTTVYNQSYYSYAQQAQIKLEEDNQNYQQTLEQLNQNRIILATPPETIAPSSNQVMASQTITQMRQSLAQNKPSNFVWSSFVVPNTTQAGSVTFSANGIYSTDTQNAMQENTIHDTTVEQENKPTGRLSANTIRQGTEWLAVVLNDVNSDYGTEISALLLNGRFAGSIMRGNIGVSGIQNIGAQFYVIEPKDPTKEVISVHAKAISLISQQEAIATDINKHHGRNYTALMLQSAIGGYGAAYANMGASTEINRADGTIITTTNSDVDEKRIYGQMLASLSSKLASDAALLGNRPITYKIAQGTVIKVRLTQNLTY